jgi:ADP-heptose:LPS heptosyltransferase
MIAANPPRSALFIRPDTMGDLILFAPTLRAIQAAWPKAAIAVVARRAYLDLGRLLAPQVEWIGMDVDPFAQSPGDCGPEVARLRRTIGERRPDLVVAAAPRRSWLDAALAADWVDARRVAFASSEEDPFFGIQLASAYGVTTAEIFSELAPPGGGEQDWLRNYGLADWLLGRAVERKAPALELGPENMAAANGALGELGLEAGAYAACAAAGFANVRIKTWPADRYAAVLSWLEEAKGVPALLIGQQDERRHLEAIAARTRGAKVWTGTAGQLPVLAGLIASSRLYLGNDTGAMHLAAALSRPIAAVFGGGTWPRFVPAAARAISVVNPLPCFGCGWDCAFGDGPCVAAVKVEDVCGALEELLGAQNPSAPASDREAASVMEVANIGPSVAEWMGKTAAVARARAAEHLARERKLEEIVVLAREKDDEIASLKQAATDKDREIENLKAATDEKDEEISALKGEADEKDEEIAALKRATDEKDAEISALKRSTNEKDAEIDALKRAADEKDAEIGRQAFAANERLELVIRLDARVKELEAACQPPRPPR